MTEHQEAQLRAILEIEGSTSPEIEATIANARKHPSEARKWVNFIRNWHCVTEAKH